VIRTEGPGKVGRSGCPLAEPLSGSEIRVLRYLPTNLTAPEIAREQGVELDDLFLRLAAFGRKLD
jgi:LuxR family transcriptional regulator, maltose regulon positive regulatory protein